MKNKLMFRILGALASALIIVSMFIPFINGSGYSQSIWEAYKITNALYLPIMIIVFGGIGVLSFSLNIKTEFAYSTSGAILFYLITETVSFVNKDMLNSLSVGYYSLIVGALVTAIMAFLCNLRTKKIIEQNEPIKTDSEIPVLNQIDKLYDDQNVNNLTQDNDSLNSIIQPLPVVNNIEPLNINETRVTSPVREQQPQVIPEIQPIEQPQIIQEVKPIEQTINGIPNGELSNPVVAEFEIPVEKVVEQQPPFFTPVSEGNIVIQPIEQPQEQSQDLFNMNQDPIKQNNPVVSEFMNQSNSMLPTQEVPTISSVPPTNNNSNLDIFN